MHSLNQHPLMRKYQELNAYGNLLGMTFEVIKEGEVKYTMDVTQEHLATPKAAHGGMLLSLLDATVGVGALSAVCEENKVVSTVEIKVNFFTPILIGDHLTSISTMLKKGKRLIFMEATVRNQRAELVAKASATLNAYDAHKAGY